MYFCTSYSDKVQKVYLHIGSNVGDSMKVLEKAVEEIEKTIGKIALKSSYYRTEPWGVKNQNDFINQAILVRTTLLPLDLLRKVKEIEQKIGRTKTSHWGPRVIDIDIIMYGSEIVENGKLIIPHREMTKRNFVLIPMMEIAGDVVHPILDKTIEDLYIESDDECEVLLIETKK